MPLSLGGRGDLSYLSKHSIRGVAIACSMRLSRMSDIRRRESGFGSHLDEIGMGSAVHAVPRPMTSIGDSAPSPINRKQAVAVASLVTAKDCMNEVRAWSRELH